MSPTVAASVQLPQLPTPPFELSSGNQPTIMPRTPPPRRSAPPRTSDSSSLTQSARRFAARCHVFACPRTSPPPSPTPSSPPLRRSVRTIQPQHFYGDSPTPPLQQTKLCSRNNHWKPLVDYIDSLTGKEYNQCKDCRLEIAQVR